MQCPVCGGAHEAHSSCPDQAEGSRVGQVVAGKYRLVRRIAEGGMATVYEATHVEIGRSFALKLLRSELRSDPTLLARFKHEAAAAGALESEHIAAVVDFGVLEDDTPYIVLELLRGEDLSERLARDGFVHPEEALDILVQACAGLERAHAAGVIHRDLKPGNVFLCRREGGKPLVKLLDFGVARSLGREPSAHTEVGAVMGTPWYMSPEQARGERELDARTDVYSLGVVLFEMLSGEKPHRGENTNALLHQIATADAPSLSARCPILSEALCRVVERALAREPAARFASASEFAAALLPFTRAGRTPARGETPSSARERAASSERTVVQFPSGEEATPEVQEPATPSPLVEAEGVDRIPIQKAGVGAWLLAAAALVMVVSLWLWQGRTAATPGPVVTEDTAPAAVEPARVAIPPPLVPTAAPMEVAPVSSAPMEVAPVSSALAEAAPTEVAPASAVSATGAVTAAASPTSLASLAPPVTAAPPPSARPAPLPSLAASAFITVNAIPIAQVFVDGKPIGSTPKVGYAVEPGTHTVVVVHPERGRQSRVTVLAPGETKLVLFRFDEPPTPAPEPTRRVDCTQDFYVDRDGIRRLKPECLLRESNPYR